MHHHPDRESSASPASADADNAYLDMAILRYERFAAKVFRSGGGLWQEYANELSYRNNIARILPHVSESKRDLIIPRLEMADIRFRAATNPTEQSVWGARNQKRNGWIPEREWWYFRQPFRLGRYWDRFGWHFLPRDGRLRKPLPDGTRPRITARWSYHADRTIEMQWRRLEAYQRPLDALLRGAGPIACAVRLDPPCYEVLRLNRIYATTFTVLRVENVTDLLDRFALETAEQILLREREAGREPLHVLWRWIANQRAWLDGIRPLPLAYPPRPSLSLPRVQWEEADPEQREPWQTWWEQRQREGWPKAQENAVFATVLNATYRQSNYSSFGNRVASIHFATQVGVLTPDEVNAELERRLMTVFPIPWK